MIYVLGKVINNGTTSGFICASFDINDYKKPGMIKPNFYSITPSDLILALSNTQKKLVELGKSTSWARQFNKGNIANVSLINGMLSTDVNAPIPILELATRKLSNGSPLGLVLTEMMDFDTRETQGYFIAIYNSKTTMFEIGRVAPSSLINYMAKITTDTYFPFANARLGYTESGLLVVYPVAAGYPRLEAIGTLADKTESQMKNLRKIDVKSLNAQKKVLGNTTVQMMKGVAQSSLNVIDENDLFRNFKPEQVSCIQRYYMEYTRLAFECLKRNSRVDISPEKLVKLDSFRISKDAEWHYRGILMARKKGQYKCSLGHPLLRAHIAECPSIVDDEGKPARLLFGSTCAADFFNLDSSDMPILRKVESIMVQEIDQFIEYMNSNTVDEGWKKVDLLLHMVNVIDRNGRLEEVFGASLASLLRQFRDLNLPYPKSLTELVQMTLRYSLDTSKADDSLKQVLPSYIRRKALDSTVEESLPHSDDMRIFKAYFGNDQYKKMVKRFSKVMYLFNIILKSKIQGDYGWDPNNKSTGFRGYHNESARRYYMTRINMSRRLFGVIEFTGKEFETFNQVMQLELALGDRVDFTKYLDKPSFNNTSAVVVVRDTFAQSVLSDSDHIIASGCILSPILATLHDLTTDSKDRYNRESLRVSILAYSATLFSAGRFGYVGYLSETGNYSKLKEQAEKSKQSVLEFTLDTLRSNQKEISEFISNLNKNLEDKFNASNLLLPDDQEVKDSIRSIKSSMLNLNERYKSLDSSAFYNKDTEEKSADTLSFSVTDFLSAKFSLSGDKVTAKLIANTSKLVPRRNGADGAGELEATYTYSESDKLFVDLSVINGDETKSCSKLSFKDIRSSREPKLTIGVHKNSENIPLFEITFLKSGTVEYFLAEADKKYSTVSRSRSQGLLSYYTKASVSAKSAKFNDEEFISNLFISRLVIPDKLEDLIFSPTENFTYSILFDAPVDSYAKLAFVRISKQTGEAESMFTLSLNEAKITNDGNGITCHYSLRREDTGEDADGYLSLPTVLEPNTEVRLMFSNLKRLGIGVFHKGYSEPDFTSICMILDKGKTFTIDTIREQLADIPKETVVESLSDSSKEPSTSGEKEYFDDGDLEIEDEDEEVKDIDRNHPPKQYNSSSELDAIVYAYQKSNLVSPNTEEVDKLIASKKPFDKYDNDERKLFLTELAYLVSYGKLDMSYFNLRYRINTFITAKDRVYEGLFIDLESMIDEIKSKKPKLSDDESKALKILRSVVRYGKLTQRQRPYVELAEKVHDRLYPGNYFHRVEEYMKPDGSDWDFTKR